MAAVVGGVISGVGSLASGLIGSSAAKSASSAELGYLNSALSYEKGVYSDATTNLTPWISGGQKALAQYEGGLGLGGSDVSSYWNQFTKTPYYTFPLQQQMNTMNQAAASKGLSLSGGQLTDLGKYASGYASSKWGDYMSALNTLSGLGESASGTLGNIGTNISSQVSGTSNQQASAAGSGILGSAAGTSNAITGALGGINYALGNTSSNTGSTYGGGSTGGSQFNASGGLGTWLSNLFSPVGSTAAGTGSGWNVNSPNAGLGGTY
jgi:hypothetical protein